MRCSKLTALLSLTGSVNAFFRQQTSDLHQLSCETDNPAIVRVYNGTIIGTHSNVYNQDHFLGVPFAQPPINGLRFRNPQPLNATFSNSQTTSTKQLSTLQLALGTALGNQIFPCQRTVSI